MIEWVDAEGIKFLVMAAIGMGSLLAHQLLKRLDAIGEKVDDLHDDMIRVKQTLHIKSAKGDATD
jgi:uncharacterized protein YxjI